MAIYGTALLSACLLVGLILGRLLGHLIGVDANIGGVGIAMLLLVVLCDQLHRHGKLRPPSDSGIRFWSSIYIPIVVAMAASQNVVKAVSGGMLALTAGVVVVVVSFALVPLIGRLSPAANCATTSSPDGSSSKTPPTT
jgi:malonate transporter MadL subunit